MNTRILAYIGCMVDSEGVPVGMKSVGKDTAADFARSYLTAKNITVKHIAFADPIKDLVSTAYGLDRAVYDTFQQKDSLIPEYPGWTYRKFLNYIGTNIGRQAKPTLWMDLVRERIEKELTDPLAILGDVDEIHLQMMEFGIPQPPKQTRVIQVTDVRFKNEYDLLKSLGATFILVKRPKPADMEIIVHESNVFDPSMKCDHIVDNSGSQEELQNRVKQVLDKIFNN